MDRDRLVSALQWFGVGWSVIGAFAHLYSAVVAGHAESALDLMGIAAQAFLAPGVIAIGVSLFLESRVK